MNNFLRIILINIFFHLNYTSFFLLPLFVQSLGGDEAVIGIVMGVAGIASIVIIPFTGSLIDRFGRKPFVLYGNLIMTIVALLFINVNQLNLPYLIFLRILQGFGFAFTFVSAQTIVIDITPEKKRAKGLGFFGVFTMATHALGPAIGEVVKEHFGFYVLFLVAALFSIIAIVFSYKMEETSKTKDKFVNPFMFLKGSSDLYGTLLTTMICGGGFASVLVFIATYMKANSLKPVSLFFFSYTISAILTRVFLGDLADRYGKSYVIIPSMVLYAISIFCLVYARNLFFLTVDAAVFGIAHGFIYPAMGAMVVDISGNAKGKGLSFYSGSFSLGFTLSSILSGILTKNFGYEFMFKISGMIVLMGILIFYLMNRDLKINYIEKKSD